jgi:predicted O-linked N-acetylglucosamine transferase (SPINDLY family)
MDYRITDNYADPITSEQKYSETLLRLPKCFICYSISKDINQYPIIPVRHKNITFGVFNKMNKHNKHTFRAWYEIIKNVPNSVLLIKRDTKVDYESKINSLKKIGFTNEQLHIMDHIPDETSYKNLYNNIDICLDTFPYSGTTTSCDGFLMGTPIITLSIPNRHVSNVTSSILQNMGFPELVAYSINEYIDISIKLANDMDKIIYYKQNIRNKFLELMNEKIFTDNFDKLLYQTYQNYVE